MRRRVRRLQWSGAPGRGSPGSHIQPLRAATRREALPVRRTHHLSVRLGFRTVQRRVGRSRALSGLATALLLTGCAALAACDASTSSGATPSSPPTSSTPTTAPTSGPTQLPSQTLTFGVIGSRDEVDAYRQMASLFAPLNRQVTVQIKAWPTDTAMMADLRRGVPAPDV